jgi:hypothetical protein
MEHVLDDGGSDVLDEDVTPNSSRTNTSTSGNSSISNINITASSGSGSRGGPDEVVQLMTIEYSKTRV